MLPIVMMIVLTLDWMRIFQVRILTQSILSRTKFNLKNLGYRTVQHTNANLETTETPNKSKLGTGYNVYQVHMDRRHPNDSNNEYNGVCVDTGAERTVIGLQQAKAYYKTFKRSFRPKPNSNLYLFGKDRRKSLEAIPIRIPTRIIVFIEVMADCSVWLLYQDYRSLRVRSPSSPLAVMAYEIKSSASNHCSRV
jgi:hypothetical protein